MSNRLLVITAFALAAACPAHADLEVRLSGKRPAARAASKKQPAAPRPGSDAARVASAALKRLPQPPVFGETWLGSRSMPSPIGIVRRGGAPVLPPVDGTPAAPLPETAAPPQPAREFAVSARLGRMLAAADAHRLPDPRSQWLAKVPANQQVAILSQWNGWFAILMGDGTRAYVPQTYVEVLPYQVRTVMPAARPAPDPRPASPAGTGASIAPLIRGVLQEAFRYRGVPYVYGGNSEDGIDCSGLVKNCFAARGVQLPRRASEQAQIGEPVPLDQLQPGDRIYFSVKKPFDHTGIYVGGGYFIHASMSRGKVDVDHLSTPLYGKNLAAARRL